MRTNARYGASMAAWLLVAMSGLVIAGNAAGQGTLINEQVGAALAMPLVGGEAAGTYLTVSNVGPEDRILHFNVISGRDWNVTDFDCPVTASETVLLRWESIGGGLHRLSMECNFAGAVPKGVAARVFPFSEGVLFVTAEEEIRGERATTTRNDLLGDFTIVEAAQGFAVGASAIPFQGKNPMAPGLTDRDYHFDNVEYSMFPATLATNFIAPGVNLEVGQRVSASLILFTLDGRANIGSQAALDLVFFDDDETPTSAHYDFDCFSIVPLQEINPNFDFAALGSGSGHVYLTSIDADQDSNVHDNKFGNGNALRVVGVHGWLLQTAQALAVELPVEDQPVPLRRSAWMRPLAQGMLPQFLDGSDVPTFDGL